MPDRRERLAHPQHEDTPIPLELPIETPRRPTRPDAPDAPPPSRHIVEIDIGGNDDEDGSSKPKSDHGGVEIEL